MICSAWKMHPGTGWFKGEGDCVGGWYLDGLCIQMWGNHSSCSPDCFHSDSNQPLPKGLSQKIVPLVFQNKTCINGFFHGKPLALQMIQTVNVSSLLCFSALNPPPTFPRQDSGTQSACLSDFLGSIHVNNFSLVIWSPVFLLKHGKNLIVAFKLKHKQTDMRQMCGKEQYSNFMIISCTWL